MKYKTIISSIAISIVGFFDVETAQGMANSPYQQLESQNSESNTMFLPVVKRRFSEETTYSSSFSNKKQKTEQGSFTSLNPQQVRETNIMFLPVVRNSNNNNQVNTLYDLSQQKEQPSTKLDSSLLYSARKYPQAITNDISSALNVSDVLQISARQSTMNLEKVKMKMCKQIVNLERQNEILKKRIQSYVDKSNYDISDKITELESQVTILEKYIKAQNKKHKKEILSLKEKLNQKILKPHQVFVLAQQNEELKKELQNYKNQKNDPRELAQLRKQVSELKEQIATEKTKHEEKIQELEDKLQNERDLNFLYSLGSEAMFREKN